MADLSVFPYYYPTTVALIDDNPAFLQSLSLQLHEDLAYLLYTRPQEALARINRPRTEDPLYRRVFRGEEQHRSTDRVIHLDLALIEREISNPARFEDISVVVVDYDMPAMNGLEFCHAVQDSRIKKVLFTGVADEKVAVRAFNEGAIDRFILKNQSDAVSIVNQTIAELQRAYFREISSTLTSTLMLDPPGFLTDPVFLRMFHELMRESRIIEYYLVSDPLGFLMLSDQGEICRLVIMDAQELEKQARWAREQGAPEAIVAAVERGDAVTWFYETIDSYFDEGAQYDWSEYVLPARILEGGRRWYYAVLGNPPVDVDFDRRATTYAAYLERLDQNGG